MNTNDKTKILLALLFGGFLFGSLILTNDKPIKSFGGDVIELVKNDKDQIIQKEEGAILMKKIDGMLLKIKKDCPNFKVQELEQYKELRKIFIFKNNDDEQIHETVIIVNTKNKESIEKATKNLTNIIIEGCK